MNNLRDYISFAEKAGLKYLGLEHRGKHAVMIVMNSAGEIYRQPISRGHTSSRSRFLEKLRSNFRRHAMPDRPHPGRDRLVQTIS